MIGVLKKRLFEGRKLRVGNLFFVLSLWKTVVLKNKNEQMATFHYLFTLVILQLCHGKTAVCENLDHFPCPLSFEVESSLTVN